MVSANSTKKVLGTANYIAPEMITEEGEITDSVDYWALGVILYELYTEDLPFYSNSVNETLDNIVNCRINWELLQNAEFISEEAFDLTNNPYRQSERVELYGRGRSLSIGDIVEVCANGETTEFLCDSFGWIKL